MKMLMFAHNGSLNRGCEAIVRSSTSIIKEKMINTKVYLASGQPETDKIINQLDAVYEGSERQLKKYSFEWFLSSFKVKFLKDESYALGKMNTNIIKHIKDMDVFLSIGGDNYCYGEQPGWYEIDRRVKAQGKKLVLWACSIGREDLSARKLEDLRQFDLILSREKLTYELLKEKGLMNVKLCADPAFTMAKEELELPEGWEVDKTVGLNFSPLVLNKNRESENSIRKLVHHILSTTDLTIALTPHVIQEGNNDYEVLYELYSDFRDTGRVIILPDNLTAMQYKGYIARMRFFIGARTHATIAAYSSHVPTMVLGYSVKSKGIAMDIFGEDKLVLGIDEISDFHKLKVSFDQMIKEESNIIRKLEEEMPKIKMLAYKSVEHLNELMTGGE